MKTWIQETPSLFDSPVFDAAKSAELANTGIAQAEANKRSLVKHAREIAKDIAKTLGYVHADLVMAQLIQEGIPERALGNSSGAVFRDGSFEWDGRSWHKSARVIGKGNMQRVWKLRK